MDIPKYSNTLYINTRRVIIDRFIKSCTIPVVHCTFASLFVNEHTCTVVKLLKTAWGPAVRVEYPILTMRAVIAATLHCTVDALTVIRRPMLQFLLASRIFRG